MTDEDEVQAHPFLLPAQIAKGIPHPHPPPVIVKFVEHDLYITTGLHILKRFCQSPKTFYFGVPFHLQTFLILLYFSCQIHGPQFKMLIMPLLSDV